MPAVRVLNPVRGMPFRWSLNPYRGCAHGCTYCYARATHEYLGFNSAGDFESVILAKLDAPRQLARELASPSWKRELVAVGTATDPYQPVEGRLRLTSACLAVLLRFRTPISLVTKSTLVVRDADLLARLSQVAAATMVWVSLATLDSRLARQVEPGAPAPARRLQAVARLAGAGVPVGVLVAPVLPGLTDGYGHLRALVQAARDAGAWDVRAHPLRLCPGGSELFAAWMACRAPELGPVYRRLYAGRVHVSPRYAEHLEARFERLRRQAGFGEVGRGAGTNHKTPGVYQLRLPWWEPGGLAFEPGGAAAGKTAAKVNS